MLGKCVYESQKQVIKWVWFLYGSWYPKVKGTFIDSSETERGCSAIHSRKQNTQIQKQNHSFTGCVYCTNTTDMICSFRLQQVLISAVKTDLLQTHSLTPLMLYRTWKQKRQQKAENKCVSLAFCLHSIPPQPQQPFVVWHETTLKAALLLPRQRTHVHSYAHHPHNTSTHLLTPESSSFEQRVLYMFSLYRTSTNPNPAKHALVHAPALSFSVAFH